MPFLTSSNIAKNPTITNTFSSRVVALPVKPLKLVFINVRESSNDIEKYNFIVSLDGSLEKASIAHAKSGAEGSSVHSKLDITSPDVKKRLQHELNFWLYGKYHKDPTDWLKDLEEYRKKALAVKKPPTAPEASKTKP